MSSTTSAGSLSRSSRTSEPASSSSAAWRSWSSVSRGPPRMPTRSCSCRRPRRSLSSAAPPPRASRSGRTWSGSGSRPPARCDFGGAGRIDLITASLPFEDAAYERASVHPLFGVRLPFPSPEDLILLKVLAGRDKDMLDAAGVVRRHGDRLDVAYLERTLLPICELAEDMAPWSRLRRLFALHPPTGA